MNHAVLIFRRENHLPASMHLLIRLLGACLLLFVINATTKDLLAAPLPETQVTLRWDSSPTVEVTGYRVYYGEVSGGYVNMADAGNSNRITIQGLVSGVTYYFVVSAYDATGLESEFSNEVSYTPAPSVTPTVFNLQLHLTAAGQIMLSATGPAGRTYDLLASTDLKNWTLIARVTMGTGGTLDFIDPDAANYPARFYRAMETQPDIQLKAIANGQAILSVIGQNNHTYNVQATPDLQNWTVIGSITLGLSGTVDFFDDAAANEPVRFYRTQDLQP